MRQLVFLLSLACSWASVAQVDSALVPNSRNGWYLPPHGTIRILVLFAEIDYDLHPEKDPQPGGAAHWAKGQLPTWKDDVFDPQPLSMPKAMVSRYYHDISLGNYVVLGDYIDRILTIKESEHPNLGNVSKLAIQEANKLPKLRTAHGLGIADFDLWKDGGQPGLPKKSGQDDPHRYDHVMTILRNSGLTHGQGSTDPGSSGKLFGYESDTQSRFGGMNALPFEILKHEYNHLLLGGNNFHSGGGNASQFQSYFISLQGGWSMMGAASSSLLTCSGWDRDRLDWRPPGATHRIRARDARGMEVNGDLDPVNGDTGLYVLRDFVTSGDALRIKLPLPEEEYPQWIWVENHQTYARNGSPTDRYHWEATGAPCVEPAVPGIYMQVQVDRDKRVGSDIYGGYADYLHPLTASGHYDLTLSTDPVRNNCPFGGQTVAFVQRDDLQNPLTGNCEQECPVYDRDASGKLERKKHYVPVAAKRGNTIHDNASFFGRSAHAFTAEARSKLGMGTNPGSANVLTLVSSGTNDLHRGARPNNRVVYLNGISVEIRPEPNPGRSLAKGPIPISVRVRANDTFIDRDLRWCADSIVLPAMRGHGGHSLHLAAGHTITLDRSRTPTRLDRPEQKNGVTYFSGATRFTASEGAVIFLERKARLDLRNGTEVHLMPGSELILDPKATLLVDATSRIVVHGDAKLTVRTKTLDYLLKRGRLVETPASE